MHAHTTKAQQKYPAVWVGLSNNLHIPYISCLVIMMVFCTWKVATTKGVTGIKSWKWQKILKSGRGFSLSAECHAEVLKKLVPYDTKFLFDKLVTTYIIWSVVTDFYSANYWLLVDVHKTEDE